MKTLRLTSLLLAITMLLSVVPFSVFAQENDTQEQASVSTEVRELEEGICGGEEVFWSFDSESGVLTISGTGAMTDYPSLVSSPFSGKSEIEAVVVEEGVTSIGTWAFYDCSNLEVVTLPSTLDNIGAKAFASCESLIMSELRSGVKTIGVDAFYDCLSLKTMTIPSTVEKIEARTFYMCENLESVTIEPGVTSVGERAFYGCDALKKVTIPESVKEIGDKAFGYDEASGNSVLNADFTIYGIVGSEAQAYADSHAMKFVPISEIPITSRTITGIEVVNAPAKVVYNCGESFSSVGLVIAVKYSDGTSKYVSASDELDSAPVGTFCGMVSPAVLKSVPFLSRNINLENSAWKKMNVDISGFDSSIIGIQTLTVTYQEQTTTFDVEIVEDEHIVVPAVVKDKNDKKEKVNIFRSIKNFLNGLDFGYEGETVELQGKIAKKKFPLLSLGAKLNFPIGNGKKISYEISIDDQKKTVQVGIGFQKEDKSRNYLKPAGAQSDSVETANVE
ncbi:MAG: leucine-rich repeat domain-containing protein, partial [Clostridia bacterium]|nr:leucine-rich repeat domain-containing protein [Clostridia bacterium]